MLEVLLKKFPAPSINQKEIYRYLGILNGEIKINSILEKEIDDVKKECLDKLQYSVCYIETPISVKENVVDFGFGKILSESISKHLRNCDSAIIFASTIGLEIDRLIYKYGKVSPSKSLILQAIGTERIESLCDSFCKFIEDEKIKENLKTTNRFSPGYGDFPLSFQKEIFSLLKPESKMALTLNESLIMTPSKSVTAVIGIGKTTNCDNKKCQSCEKKDCTFRSK